MQIQELKNLKDKSLKILVTGNKEWEQQQNNVNQVIVIESLNPELRFQRNLSLFRDRDEQTWGIQFNFLFLSELTGYLNCTRFV